jgi:creatinine amidohydrolase
MKLSEMSWKDVETHLETSDALLIPAGTCEQHGLHLPLACDTLIAEAFAERIAEATGVPLAPALPYGVNLPCDRFVPGTAGFSFDGLRTILRDLLADWTRQGFRRFFVVTAHGCATNGFGFAHHEAIKEAALPLLTEGSCEVFVLFPYWTDVKDLLSRQATVEHACEVETSLALYLFPGLVRMELARDRPEDGGGETRFRAFPEGVAAGPPSEGWTGAEGYPTSATAEKGRRIFERCLEQMVRLVRASSAGVPDGRTNS